MKHRGWLLLALSFLCLTTELRPTLAHGSSKPSSFHAESAQGFYRNRGMIPVELNHLSAVDFVLPGNLRPLPTQARSSPICQVWDTQSNDDGQADDNSDDSGGVNVALSERCICPTDWRLIQPDAQFANHFIHAKTKPPP